MSHRDISFEDQAEALIGVLKQYSRSKTGQRNALLQVVEVLRCTDMHAREDALTEARDRIARKALSALALTEIEAMLRDLNCPADRR